RAAVQRSPDAPVPHARVPPSPAGRTESTDEPEDDAEREWPEERGQVRRMDDQGPTHWRGQSRSPETNAVARAEGDHRVGKGHLRPAQASQPGRPRPLAS